MDPLYIEKKRKGKSPKIEAFLKKYYGNTLDIKKKNKDYAKKLKEKKNDINLKKKIKSKKKVFSNAFRKFSNLKDILRTESEKKGKFGLNKIKKKPLKYKSKTKSKVRKNKLISNNIKSKKNDDLKVSKNKKHKLNFSWDKKIEDELTDLKEVEKTIEKNLNKKNIEDLKNEKEVLKIGETIKNLNITEMGNSQYFSFNKKFPNNKMKIKLKEKEEKKKKMEKYNSNNFFIVLQKNLPSLSSDSYKQIFKNSIKSQKRNPYQKLLLNPSNISSEINPSLDLKIINSSKLDSNLLKTEKKYTNESSSMLSETIGKIKYVEDGLKKKYKGNYKKNKNESLVKKKIIYDSLCINDNLLKIPKKFNSIKDVDFANRGNLVKIPKKINSERDVNLFNFLNSTNKKKKSEIFFCL